MILVVILTIVISATSVSFLMGLAVYVATRDFEDAWQSTWTTFLFLLVAGLVLWALVAALTWAWGVGW
jgi:hypothetical protein